MGRDIDTRILGSLRCPCCSASLSVSENTNSLFCGGERKHCYDISSSGHINFALRHNGGGDSKEAVRSRRDFLDSGAYAPVADALAESVLEYATAGGHIVDAGCGEGYYSSRIARDGYAVSGFDLSKDAVISASKRAAREGKENLFFGVASVYELPLCDGCADAVVNVFAPCAEEEYARVLKNDGVLCVAYAGPEHLMGLKRAIYDETYENAARADMPKSMRLLTERRVRYDIHLDSTEQILNLFSMTPYYWRTSEEDKKKLEGLSLLYTPVDIIIAIYKKDRETV